MKTKHLKSGKISITGLTAEEYSVICSVVYSSKRCFPEQEDNGEWYSNDDFVCILTDEEKRVLDNIEL